MLNHALAYAARGWRVFPVHGFDASGNCTCPKGADCPPKSRGKHPRLLGWPEVATADQAQVANWWATWPDANIGIATGRGLLVLDVDVKHESKRGDLSLSELEGRHGQIPPTLVVQTPSLGWHLYLTYPPELHLKKSIGTLGPGLDVMAEGGYVVAPPSQYVNGKRASYAVVADADLAPVPDWIAAHASAPAAPKSRERSGVPERQYPAASPDVLEAAREALRRLGPAVEGEGGDQRTFRAAAILMGDYALEQAEAWPLLLEWNATCRPPWTEEDLGRKLWGGEKYAAGERGAERDAVLVEASLRAAALAAPGPAAVRAQGLSPDSRYTAEDVARFAGRQGCSPEEWRKRWVIQHGSTYWIWINGRYSTPVPSTSALLSAKRFLAPAGLDFEKPLKNGGYRDKTLAEVMDEYGSPAERVEAHLDRQESSYVPLERTFHEAVCHVRDDLAPEFNPLIDHWLRLFGGPVQELLLNWVASVTALSKPCCALYLCAEKDAGKGLFAEGHARIWSLGGPSSLKHVLGNFNETLVRCPLVFADEKLPKLPGQAGISGDLRSIIAESNRTLNRKHLSHANLGGCIRLVVGANNDHVLEDRSEHDLTRDDTEAIASRYLFVDARPRSAEIREFLNGLGGRAYTEAWVEGDGIARHALWLRDNRVVTPGRRFLVEGVMTGMHEAVAWSYGITGSLLTWLCRYLEYPMKISQQAGAGVLCGNGVLLATASTISEFWMHYPVGGDRQPSETMIGRQLRNISRRKKNAVVGGRRRRYCEIDLQMLFSFAEKETDLDAEELKRRVNAVDASWSWE